MRVAAPRWMKMIPSCKGVAEFLRSVRDPLFISPYALRKGEAAAFCGSGFTQPCEYSGSGNFQESAKSSK